MVYVDAENIHMHKGNKKLLQSGYGSNTNQEYRLEMCVSKSWIFQSVCVFGPWEM